MDKDQFRQAQLATGLNGNELAAILGVKTETVSRWRHGMTIHPCAAVAMQALASGWRP